MKVLSIVSLLFLLSTFCLAQPTVEWVSTFGTDGSDQCYDVQPAIGGGYVMIGHYNPDGTGLTTRDLAVVKVDADGNLVWEQTYGGAGQQRGFAIQQAPWGDYIACGFTENGNDDFYLLKISDEDGTLIDSHEYDNSGDDWAYDLEIFDDNSFVITGKTQSGGATAGYTALISDDFEIIWEEVTTANEDAWLRGVHVDANGVTVAGYFEDEGSNNELMIRQFDQLGNFNWSAISGTASTNDDQLYNVVGANDGGYVGAGYIRNPSNNRLLAIMKVDNAGVLEWTQYYGGLGLDWGYDIDNYGDGYVAVAYGNSFGEDPANTDMLLYALDEDGDSLWMMTLGQTPTFDKATTVLVNQVQDILVGGYTRSYGATHEDFCLIKVHPEENTPPGASSLIAPEDNFTATTDSIYFQWTEAIDPDPDDHVTYNLQISLAEDFEEENVIFAHQTAELFYTCWEILPDDSELFWRVLSIDDAGAETASNVYTLNIAYPEPPHPFSLISPENGAEIAVGDAVTFNWEETTDPDPDSDLTYLLEFCSEDNFEQNVETINPGASTTITVEGETFPSETFWRILAQDNNTAGTYSNEVGYFYYVDNVEESPETGLPLEYGIQTYPNPFNPSVNIKLAVPVAGNVSAVVYDLLGREVLTLGDKFMTAGYHTFSWTAEVSTGTYLLVVEAESGWQKTEKLIFMK